MLSTDNAFGLGEIECPAHESSRISDTLGAELHIRSVNSVSLARGPFGSSYTKYQQHNNNDTITNENEIGVGNGN